MLRMAVHKRPTFRLASHHLQHSRRRTKCGSGRDNCNWAVRCVIAIDGIDIGVFGDYDPRPVLAMATMTLV